MSRTEVTIQTADGVCRSFVFRPEGEGPWPAVIFYMDGLGIRPVLFEMCQEIADGGYLVLLPDLYYRVGPYEPFDPKEILSSEERRQELFTKYVHSTSNTMVARDSAAYLAYLDTLAGVRGRAVGVAGYCMGGGIALTVAGVHPERVAAAASFHGGRMVTDAEHSPHRHASRIRAKVLVAGADEDRSFSPADRDSLATALAEAGVDARVEIWEGALHGWTMRDFEIYNPEAARRHVRETGPARRHPPRGVMRPMLQFVSSRRSCGPGASGVSADHRGDRWRRPVSPSGDEEIGSWDFDSA